MPMHPGRVERVGRVSGKGWPALAGGLPYPHHLPDGEGEAGRRSGRGPPVPVAGRWRGGGEVVAMVSRPEPDGMNPSSSAEGVTW